MLQSLRMFRRCSKDTAIPIEQELIIKGKEKLNQMVDIFMLIKQVEKLKALVSVLVKEDEQE
jgi:hypothetical protein